jgi:uncharacterized membrane protein YsdA (DUF1294 family)
MEEIMNDPLSIFLVFLFLNGLAFILMGLDKEYAKRQAWRISEQFLLGLALLGGSLGIFLGMYYFRHKTRKPLFQVGVPFIFCLQVILLISFSLQNL